ncbi:hypothetical protein OROHE_013724 [Orobanche hederae]
MEKKIGGEADGIVAVVVAALVVVVVAANCVDAQMYACWGGCYNECLLRSNRTSAERFACYYQCFNSSCVPPSAADYQYYCQIGCNLERCTPFSSVKVVNGRNVLGGATTYASLEEFDA